VTGRLKSGYIFIEALILIAGLLAVLAIISSDQKANGQQAQNRLRERRATAAAEAAVARAVAVLQNDDPNIVTLSDDWAQLGDSGSTQYDLGEAVFRMQIVDAGSMVNANTAPTAQLQRLPLSQEQIDSLLDWREPGAQPRTDGAKNTYYNQLPQPYNADGGPLNTLDELLLVRYWTAQTLYQPMTNTTATVPEDSRGNALPLAAVLTVDSGAPDTMANGRPRVNLSQPSRNPNQLTELGVSAGAAQQIAAGGTYQSFQTLLAVPNLSESDEKALLNGVTFSHGGSSSGPQTGSQAGRVLGKINLNTASESVLETIPNVTPGIASSIVDHQTDGFNGMGDLATLSGMSASALAQIADNFTVGCDTWIVRAYGECGGVGVAVEAVVGVRGGQAEILNWDRLNTGSIPLWWDWNKDGGEIVNAGVVQ
jgi:DNA uptake protein ComE-like DNA-binding protein